MNYIAYYRVSTKTQGDSGLGLEAQRKAVTNYLTSGVMNEGDTVKSVTEIESGRKNDRPMLQEAIQLCKDNGATLIIAKLDRLSRNANFTLSLVESEVKFVAVDMPQANELTIGILAVLAQDEAKRISDRTKSALSVIKDSLDKNGVHVSKQGNEIRTLGTPANLTQEARWKSIQTRRDNAKNNDRNKMAFAFAKEMKSKPLYYIAMKLNNGSFKTSTGALFGATSVSRLFKLYDEKR